MVHFEKKPRNFPNNSTTLPGGAYLGQMTFILYKNAKMAQKGGGALVRTGRIFGRGAYL